MPDAPRTINTVQGPARFVRTEVEDANGRWNDSYTTRDGYYVVHRGSHHDVYEVVRETMVHLGLRDAKKAIREAMNKAGIGGYIETIDPHFPEIEVSLPDESSEDRKAITEFENEVIPKLTERLGWIYLGPSVGMGSTEFSWREPRLR